MPRRARAPWILLALWVVLLISGLLLVASETAPIPFFVWLALTAPILLATLMHVRWETPRGARRVLGLLHVVWAGFGILGLMLAVSRTGPAAELRWVVLVQVVALGIMLVIVARVLRASQRATAARVRPEATEKCPAPPESDGPEDLTFTRQPMVRWFDPAQLASTGLKAVLGGVFGAYADKREIQAGVAPPSDHDYSDSDDLWLDYVADLGDGWNSTFSVASLLGRAELDLTGGIRTRRGQLLVLGGDQVYPTATREQYQNRFAGPYQAALPCVTGSEPPHLFAVPGNHDWYDGLTSFQRLFCQHRWIGGWKTQQTRSYFAIKLPHGWWLWGVDFQLTTDIDWPQLEYFRRMAARLAEGDRIILCTPEPSWVYCETHGPAAYQNLEYFERTIIAPSRGRVALNLTGDLHHYCRYHHDGRHKITSGGGGAFLHATHRTPKALDLPEGGTRVRYERAATYPGIARSWWLKFAVFRFPWRNPAFAVILGAFYLLGAWFLESASKKGGGGLLTTIASLRPGFANAEAALSEFYGALAHSPGSVAMVLVLVAGLVAFADLDTRVPRIWGLAKRWGAGLVHGLVHLGLLVYLTWYFAYRNIGVLELPPDTPLQMALFSAEMLLLGGALGAAATAIYLLLANVILGLHDNEVFSSQGIADYKHFLRLHIEADGALTIYPVKIERVCRAWRLETAAGSGAPWFSPLDPLHGELIEDPVHFPAAGAVAAGR